MMQGIRVTTGGQDQAERQVATSVQFLRADQINKAIRVKEPLTEASGTLAKARRPKTPASKRWVQLPPVPGRTLRGTVGVFVGEKGGNLRRSNFARRFWRPVWDGDPDNPVPEARIPPILTGFIFHEGRHTPSGPGRPEMGSPTLPVRPGWVTSCPAWPMCTSTSHPR
jgi:hypothetical protein